MSRPTRGGTVEEPSSRDKRLIRVREQLIMSGFDKSTSLLKMMTNIHIQTQKCPAIDKGRSCMGVVVAAILLLLLMLIR